jgi:hypothetical protein
MSRGGEITTPGQGDRVAAALVPNGPSRIAGGLGQVGHKAVVSSLPGWWRLGTHPRGPKHDARAVWTGQWTLAAQQSFRPLFWVS